MSANFAALRSNLETALAGRVAAPFNYRDRNAVPTVPTGIPEIDALTGGLPRGALTEIFGPPCSGRTSLLLAALAARTADGESCALIDGCDAFDPHSAEAAGVDLKKILWVRCKNIDQALRSADLLLQSGGFGFVALDLTDIAPRLVRQVPLDSWFRFRRAVEDSPTILVLLDSLGAHTELLRSRVQRAAVGSGRASFRVDSPAGEAVFHAKTNWDSRNDALAALRLK
jgi:RecA/RadA recombinase